MKSWQPTALFVTSIWTLLASLPLLSRLVGPDWSVGLCFAAAAGLATLQWRRTGLGASARRIANGVAVGFAGYPGLWCTTALLGAMLGLEPNGSASVSGASLRVLVCTAVFAPVFEEMLYRHSLIELLRPRCGTLLAAALSTACFAASHVSAWGILGTAVAGIALATVATTYRQLDVCVGLHAGLNLAGLGLDGQLSRVAP